MHYNPRITIMGWKAKCYIILKHSTTIDTVCSIGIFQSVSLQTVESLPMKIATREKRIIVKRLCDLYSEPSIFFGFNGSGN